MIERISEFPSLSSIDDNDLFCTVDDTDDTTKKVSAINFSDYIASNISTDSLIYNDNSFGPSAPIDRFISIIPIDDVVSLGINNPPSFADIAFSMGATVYDIPNCRILCFISEGNYTVTLSSTGSTFSDGSTSKSLTQFDHLLLYISLSDNVCYILSYKYTP
jgi:hypothetical protein